MEWILILVVVGSALALIILSKKLREMETHSTPEIEETKSPRKSNIEKRDMPKQVDPVQTTIYVYHTLTKKRCCATCDGENDLSAECCFICGEKL